MIELDKTLERIAETEEEPSAGHFERFQEKLRRKRIKNHFTVFLKVAASLVIILLSANLYLYIKLERPEDQSLSTQKNEINEAGDYYTLQINAEMNQVEQLIKQGAGSEKDLLAVKSEFSEMDDQFKNLRKDYQNNPNDDRLQNAVIQYFQAKLEILNIVKSNMEIVKQQKLMYHENNKI